MESRADEIKKALNENCSEEHCREGGGEGVWCVQRGAPQLFSFMSFKAPVMLVFLIKIFFRRLAGIYCSLSLTEVRYAESIRRLVEGWGRIQPAPALHAQVKGRCRKKKHQPDTDSDRDRWIGQK